LEEEDGDDCFRDPLLEGSSAHLLEFNTEHASDSSRAIEQRWSFSRSHGIEGTQARSMQAYEEFRGKRDVSHPLEGK